MIQEIETPEDVMEPEVIEEMIGAMMSTGGGGGGGGGAVEVVNI